MKREFRKLLLLQMHLHLRHKIKQFHLIFYSQNFVERNGLRIVSGAFPQNVHARKLGEINYFMQWFTATANKSHVKCVWCWWKG